MHPAIGAVAVTKAVIQIVTAALTLGVLHLRQHTGQIVWMHPAGPALRVMAHLAGGVSQDTGVIALPIKLVDQGSPIVNDLAEGLDERAVALRQSGLFTLRPIALGD